MMCPVRRFPYLTCLRLSRCLRPRHYIIRDILEMASVFLDYFAIFLCCSLNTEQDWPKPIERKPLSAKFNEVFEVDMTISGEVGAESATGKLAPGHKST